MNIKDFEIIKEYSKDVSIMEHRREVIESFPERLRENIQEIFRRLDTDKMLYTIMYDGEKIGEITLDGYSTATPEMGIELIEKYRGKGIGFLVSNEILSKLRESNKYDYVKYIVREENIASVKLVEKLGGVVFGKVASIPEFNIIKYRIPMTKK